MIALSANYKKFIHGLYKKLPSSAAVEPLTKSEKNDDKKLQHELDVMLSSLESCTKKKKKEQDAALQEALYGLIEKIQQATKRTAYDNQSCDPSARLQRQLDVASLGVLVDRMNKSRLVDQEWVSNAEQLKRDINELVAKSACFFTIQEEYNDQRYELSPTKERDLYLYQIFSKIDRQSSRRMTDQDAAMPKRYFEQEAEKQDFMNLLNKMQQTTKKYSDQRASLMKREDI